MSCDLNPNPSSPQPRDAPSSAIRHSPTSQAGSLFVPPPPDDALHWVPGSCWTPAPCRTAAFVLARRGALREIRTCPSPK